MKTILGGLLALSLMVGYYQYDLNKNLLDERHQLATGMADLLTVVELAQKDVDNLTKSAGVHLLELKVNDSTGDVLVRINKDNDLVVPFPGVCPITSKVL